ncbi:MAG: peptidylprolyl isomerase [Mediterranea sp.]|jgi:peptidyl-prolyl cis-trans isomerase SurA|nr:peptidylprolyl isomerase [Mediterranea sp.]
MKKFINFKSVVLSALLLSLHMVTYAQNNVIDEVVWVVGDEAILKSEVEEARMSALYERRKFDREPYCVIPEEIAVQKLFLHQAALDSIEVSEAEIIQRVDMYMNMYISDLGSREKMEEYFNKTSSQIRETLRENAREGLTVQKMQQKLVGEIKITPAEVRRYFSALPADSIPYIPTQVEVQIITQQPKVPLEETEDVKRRLREFTDRVNKGETTFSSLARMYSEDKGTALNGGEMPFVGRGQLDPAFANVAFNLQGTNKISKIVESEYGYHIIQLIEKRGDRIRVRHILLKPHVPEEALMQTNARLDSIADDIRNGKFSFEDAASVLSQDKDTRNNHGLMPNPETGTSKFQMQELPPEIAKVVDKMKVGEISEAFTMIPKTGKEECVIVKLKSRINGHKATIAEDYQNLKNIVLSKRQDQVLDKWIREKQKHTYVRINENWRNCTFKYPGWIKE